MLAGLNPATVPTPSCAEAPLSGSEEGDRRGLLEEGRRAEARRTERVDAARRRAARAAARAAAGRAYAEQRREMARRIAQCEVEVVERHRADAARAAEWRRRRDAGELTHRKERCTLLLCDA